MTLPLSIRWLKSLPKRIRSYVRDRYYSVIWASQNSIITFFTSVMAIATVIMAITTAAQWSIARKQTSQTEAIIEQMRLEQRAWLSVHSPKVINLVGNTTHEFSVAVRNVGNTPATALTIGTRTFPAQLGRDVSSWFDGVEHRRYGSVFAPDSVYTLPINGDKPFDEATINAIRAPGKTHDLYLIGVLTYTDILKVERRTQFCFRYEDSTNELASCHFHNYMD